MKAKTAAVLLSASLAGAAFGYILPGGSILRRVASGRDEVQLSTLRVDGAANFYGTGAREAGAALNLPSDRTELALDATFAIKFPSRCRLEVSSPEGGRGAVALNNGKKRVEGTEIPAAALALQEACSLLALRSGSDSETRGLMERHLRTLGVDPQKTSLGRFGGKVAYVLGDAQAGKPQFWVYKDSFQPARVMFSDPQGNAWDVRLVDYASAATGEWFPRVVEVARGQEVVMRFTGIKADSKSSLSDRLF